jgi:lipooligosaccharide transport system permease protein
MMGTLHVLNRHLQVFRRTWRHSIMFNVIEPLLYLGAMGFGLGALVQQVDGMSYIQFIAPGMVALSAMYAATFECTYGTFVRLHYQKTFQALLAGPITVNNVILGEMLYGTLKSVLFGSVILMVITALGQVHSLQALAIPLVLVVTGAVFAVLALWYTAVITSIDYLNYYITLVILPFLLFGGLYFPANSLPVWVQAANWLNPLYHSVVICRALVLGQGSGQLVIHLLILVGMGAAALPFPLRLMKKRLIT